MKKRVFNDRYNVRKEITNKYIYEETKKVYIYTHLYNENCNLVKSGMCNLSYSSLTLLDSDFKKKKKKKKLYTHK